MASRTLDVPLALLSGQADEKDFFGLARIVFSPALAKPSPTPVQETQMVFANYEPIVQSQGARSGVTVRLSEDGSKVTILSGEGAGATYLRSEIMNQPIAEAGSLVVVESYWADFAMKDGKPATKSDSPNNPAALIRISKLAETENAKPSLELAPAGDGIVLSASTRRANPRYWKRKTRRFFCAWLGGLASRTRPVLFQGRACQRNQTRPAVAKRRARNSGLSRPP